MTDWLLVENLSAETAADAEKLYQEIDKGEAEAISLCSSLRADVLLIDDLIYIISLLESQNNAF